jgi:hypothetical protein
MIYTQSAKELDMTSFDSLSVGMGKSLNSHTNMEKDSNMNLKYANRI